MLTIVAMLLCVLLALYWKLNVRMSPLEPPSFPGGLPFFGHSFKFIGDSKHCWNIFKEIAKKCNKNTQAVSMSIAFRKLYVLTDPDDLFIVANSCLQKDVLYDFAKAYLGNGLVTAEVPIWKQHRKLLNPVFNQKYMQEFLGVFNEQARNLIKLFAAETDQVSFDHTSYVGHIAMEAICKTAFGVEFSKDEDVNARYRHALDAYFISLTERFLNVWMHNNFIWSLTSNKKTQDVLLKELHSISNMILKKRKKTFHNNEDCNLDFTETEESVTLLSISNFEICFFSPPKGCLEEIAISDKAAIVPNFVISKKFKPFLDLLFELNGSYGEEIFSDEVIREHVDTFIVAGHDTVAVTLVYTLLLIGSYPDVQAKIYTELQEVFGESDRDVAKEDLPQLVYLEAVLKETLRLYPVVPVIGRIIDKDIKLKNYTLYAGNTCVFMINGVHTNAIWGDDAEQFRPERWLDQSSLSKNPHGFVAFSLGRRVCIGKTYAMYFMKTVLSHVLRHYTISGDHHKMINKFDVMLQPVTGHYISIQQR